MNRSIGLMLATFIGATLAIALGGDLPTTENAAVTSPAEDGSSSHAPAGPSRWTVLNPAAQRGGCALNIAILGAGTTAVINDVIGSLTGDPRIATLTGIAINSVTPSLAELQAFDVVLVFTNSTPQNNVLLGDVLADYVDGGGGVVLAMFAMRASLATRTIEGRFLNDNYYCITRTVGTTTTGSATLGTVYVPSSPILNGVDSFSGGSQSFRSPAGPTPNTTRIADWSTGQILIAERNDLSGGRIDLGFFPVSEAAAAGSWLPGSGGEQLLRNAVAVAAGCRAACPGDVDADGDVDLSDLTALLSNFGTNCR